MDGWMDNIFYPGTSLKPMPCTTALVLNYMHVDCFFFFLVQFDTMWVSHLCYNTRKLPPHPSKPHPLEFPYYQFPFHHYSNQKATIIYNHLNIIECAPSGGPIPVPCHREQPQHQSPQRILAYIAYPFILFVRNFAMLC